MQHELGLLVLPMSAKAEREPRPAAKARRGQKAADKEQPPAKEVPVPELAGRAEQLGAIIVKTLDLAEAGLSLGITVLTRAGAAAQEALTERGAESPAVGPEAAYAPPDAAGATAGGEEAFFLTNRLPLVPGGTARVSFSITNDSLVEPKRVQLRVTEFVGEYEGLRIDASAFTVRPARKTIAPADFEKFVLAGELPGAAPPDVYRGAVIVGSTDEMSIPVRLLVGVT